jgi:serine/threonine-protein kinase
VEQLGAYRLISRLGAGGMGEVWRAEDTRLLRPVAVKILSEKIASDPEWKARFLREARTIAQLNHPNIATIYSIEQEGEKLFIAMELVEGESLAAMIARGPLSIVDAVRIMTQAADALGEAHEKGIVHRDVKPDNILVSKRTAKVLDFGIAKQIGPRKGDDPTLTQGGMIIGTPYYMSPEQALGRPVDRRSDVFSLGTVFYEALSGKRPFTGETMTETMMHIIMNEAPDIAEVAPHVPLAVARVVRRCLEKKPEKRYQTMNELLTDMSSPAATSPGFVPLPQDTPTVSLNAPVMASPATAKHPVPPAPVETKAKIAPAKVAEPAPPPVEKVKFEPLPGQRALIADDDPMTRFLLGKVLSRHRIAFDEAENGADAVKLLKQHSYTLIFLDLMMPRVDGWGVIDFVRRTLRDKVPRLFVITGVQNQALSSADRDVVAGLIYKPLDPAEVDKVIQQVA